MVDRSYILIVYSVRGLSKKTHTSNSEYNVNYSVYLDIACIQKVVNKLIRHYNLYRFILEVNMLNLRKIINFDWVILFRIYLLYICCTVDNKIMHMSIFCPREWQGRESFSGIIVWNVTTIYVAHGGNVLHRSDNLVWFLTTLHWT